jgi:hypothetical protein
VRFGVRSPRPKVSLRERAALVHRLGYDGIELGQEWQLAGKAIQEQLAGIGAAVSRDCGIDPAFGYGSGKRAKGVASDQRRLRMSQTGRGLRD